MHVNVFVFAKFAVEVGAIEIKCVDDPVVSGGVREYNAEACESRDWGESVEIIDALSLSESARYEARLVFFDSSIGFPFDSENPLAADDILAGGFRDGDPSSRFF